MEIRIWHGRLLLACHQLLHIRSLRAIRSGLLLRRLSLVFQALLRFRILGSYMRTSGVPTTEEPALCRPVAPSRDLHARERHPRRASVHPLAGGQ